jgi:NTP pyrophosphatase (non-canonical NTP hydrolase)
VPGVSELEELIERIRRFNADRDWAQYHSPKNLSISLVIEAAELAEVFQWLTEEESRCLSDEKLASVREEVGDVFIYLLTICEKIGIDPLDAASRKLLVNGEKYPVEKSRGRSDKYTELSRQ